MIYKIFTLRIALASVTVACLVAGFLSPLAVMAVAEPTPTQHYTAAYFGGPLRAAVAASDGSFYVAGTFVNGAVSYGNAVLASASTGLSESPFPDVDGDVYVTISDEDDGWYIGGNFNRVGSLQRTGLAHILPDGTPDADFNADIVLGLGDAVYSLAIWDEVNPTLFVGGNFSGTTFSGVPVTGMVALDAMGGSLADGFSQPQISGGSETVYALTVDDGGFVYVGGDFNTIGNATSRNYLVGFDATTGATTSFNPDMDNTVNALAVASDGSKIYAGGDFTNVNVAVPRGRLAAFEPTLGTVDAFFVPEASAEVYALALDESLDLLYVGGVFTSLNVLPVARNYLAAVSTLNGLAGSFDPNLNNNVFSIALTADGSMLYAVGPFTEVNVTADPTARDGVAAFETTADPTDNVIDGFSQSVENDPYHITLSNDEESVLISVYGGAQHRADQGAVGGLGIIHVLPDGSMDPAFFNPVANSTIWALALSPDETTLYAGGDFTTVNGGPTRNYLAAFDAVTGVETSFDPDMNGPVRSLAVSSDGGTLYAGGSFTSVNTTTDPVTRNHLAAFDTAAVDPTNNATAFDPDMDDDVLAIALSSDDSTLYAGGAFNDVNIGTTRNRIAAFTTSDGLVNAFDPNMDDSVRALAFSLDEATIYAGGSFNDVNAGTARNYAAAFDVATGTATNWVPDPNSLVYALAFGPDGILYMGGNFSAVDGDDHNYIAAVDADTGAPDSGFNANLDGSVNALAHGGTDNGLLAVGGFSTSFQDPGGSEIPYVVTIGLAHFPDSSTPAPTPTPSSGNRTGGYWVGFSQPPAPGRGDPANLARYGLREGDTISTDGSPGDSGFDPDVYIVNEWGYKRLFLNPAIFNFYAHLGFSKVRSIVPVGRDAFPTSGLFRNCEAGDEKVYAVEVTGEDTGVLHHVNVSGDAAVAQDSDFFKKVFCINNNEFNWYTKSPTPYTSLSQVPDYRRPGQ